MNPNISSNGGNSGATSQLDPPLPEAELGEEKYLEREAARAHEAMKSALHDAVKEIGNGVDPRAWIDEHPWLTLGAASVAGFLAASLAIPSKEQRAVREARKVQRAVEEVKEEHREEKNGKADHKMRDGWLGIIGAELLKLARPMLTSFIASRMAAMQPADSNADGSNPQPADQPIPPGDSSNPT